MSVTMKLSGHEPEPHASDLFEDRREWAAVVEWALSLPEGEYPAVDALARQGSYAGTEELSRQMDAAALAHDPGDAGPAVELILDRLGGGHSGESVAVESG